MSFCLFCYLLENKKRQNRRLSYFFVILFVFSFDLFISFVASFDRLLFSLLLFLIFFILLPESIFFLSTHAILFHPFPLPSCVSIPTSLILSFFISLYILSFPSRVYKNPSENQSTVTGCKLAHAEHSCAFPYIELLDIKNCKEGKPICLGMKCLL